MTFQDKLYFEKQYRRFTYSNNPESGEVDVSRLAIGQPAFRSDSSIITRQKKKLILSEISLNNWSKRKVDALCVRLHALAEEGFVFYKSNGEPFTDSELTFPDNWLAQCRATPLTEKEKEKLGPIDELFLFNEEEAEILLLGDEDDTKGWDGMPNVSIKIPWTMETLCRFLEKNADVIQTLNIEADHFFDGDLPENLNLSQLQSLQYTHETDEDEQLSTYESTTLNHLIKKSPNLTQLKIEGIENPSFLNEIQNIKTITTLELRGTNISEPNINALMDVETYLSVCLMMNDISVDSQRKFLNKILTPSLESLMLVIPQFQLTDAEINLCSLQTLLLYQSSITAQQLGMMLANTNNLKELYLCDCNNLGGDFPEGINIQLSQLEKLDASDSSITAQQLGMMLAYTNNLKHLDLSWCNNLGGDFPEGINIQLSQLEKFDASYSSITAQQLGMILANTKNLKELKLLDCRELVVLKNSANFQQFIKQYQLPKNIQNLLEKALQDIRIKQYDELSNDISQTTPIPQNQHLSQQSPSITNPGKERQPLSEKNPHLTHQSTHFFAQSTIDADTSPKERTFELTRQFVGKPTTPDPSNIRKKLYQDFHLNQYTDNLQSVFSLVPFQLIENSLQPIETNQISASPLYDAYNKNKTKTELYFFRDTLTLTHQWQALPSLFPNEVLEQVFVSDNNSFQIKKDPSLSIHFISLRPSESASSKNVTVEMILSHTPSLSSDNLPQDVQDIIKNIRGFNSKPLKNISSTTTPQQYLDAIINQRTGACRHRAVVFLEKMKRLLNNKYPCRIVSNDCHMFVEVYDKDQWISCDLGGYEADLKITKDNIPEQIDTPSLLPESDPQHSSVSNTKPNANSNSPDIQHESASSIAPPSETAPKKSASIQSHVPYFPAPTLSLSPEQVVMSLIHNTSRNILVDTHQAETVRRILVEKAQNNSQMSYCVNAFEELKIPTAYFKREKTIDKKTTGQLVREQGGPLYDFFTQHPDKKHLLIINLNAFKASEIVQCNTILDESPTIDTVPVPKNCHIIVLYHLTNPATHPSKRNPNPKAYQGTDFLSRFDEKVVLTQLAEPSTTQIETPQPNERVIEFCGDLGWDSIATGYWTLQQQTWQFHENALIQAVEKGETAFVFNNAPKNNPDFQRFVHDIVLHQGIYHQGEQWASFPEHIDMKDIRIRYTEITPAFEQYFQLSRPEKETVYLLNGQHASELFSTTKQESGRHVVFDKGLIAQHARGTLSVYVTSSVSLDLWLKIYQTCQMHQTTLLLSSAPGVFFPKALVERWGQSSIAQHVWQYPPSPQTTISQDESTLLQPQASLSHESASEASLSQHPIVIDITDVNAHELLSHLEATFLPEENRFQCQRVIGFLERTLNQGKTVVLKGEWSPLLATEMHTFIIERLRQPQACQGHLHVVTQKPTLFSFVKETSVIRQQKPTPSPIVEETTYETRFDVVNRILKQHPMVLLTGATGIGKTYFIETQWKTAYPACYVGEENILKWVQDQSSSIKTLFIDEANLSNKAWSMFEGLYQSPPCIFYQGQYHELSSEHKVIFAGNPPSYGGEREMPLLFQHHDVQVQFHPMPAEILKASLEACLDDDNAVRFLLKMMNHIMHLNPNDTLITPREILMVASLSRVFQEKNQETNKQDITAIVKHFLYEICHRYIPDSHLQSFKQSLQNKQPIVYPNIEWPDFLITPQNESAVHALYAHLELRDARINTKNAIPPQGGLGGLVLEGNPGIGKSVLVKQMLSHRDLQEHQDFICLPVKWSVSKKEQALIDAFHQGQIVIIDEINSSPMLERLMNALLEGHDLQHQTAKNPGFMLIGTQNPITFSGRVATTLPLQHRLQNVRIEDYTPRDMLNILKHMNIPDNVATNMIKQMQQDPSLCFRDLEKIAKAWIKHQNEQSTAKTIENVVQNEPRSAETIETVAPKEQSPAERIETVAPKEQSPAETIETEASKKQIITAMEQSIAALSRGWCIFNKKNKENELRAIKNKMTPNIAQDIEPVIQEFAAKSQEYRGFFKVTETRSFSIFKKAIADLSKNPIKTPKSKPYKPNQQ